MCAARLANARMLTKAGRINNAYDILVEQLAAERPTIENLDEDIFSCGGPKLGTLTEISGPVDAAQEILLYTCVAKCLPPIEFGGKQCEAIILDQGHTFDVRYLINYIKRVINESGTTYTPTEHDNLIQNCLKSVDLLRVFSSEQSNIALETIDRLLMKNPNIALLAIDKLDAFYWSDSRKKRLYMISHYSKLLGGLQKLCKKHNICCIYTVSQNYIEPKSRKGTYKCVIDPWPSACITYKLKLDRRANGARTFNNRPFTIDECGGLNFLC